MCRSAGACSASHSPAATGTSFSSRPQAHSVGSRVVKLSQRKFFPAELEALVAHAGFRVVERYGDFSFRPLDATADSQVLVCVPVAKRPRK